MPGVDEAWFSPVVTGGTIYAIYELSRQLGVSPWHWWADAPVAKRDEVFICSSLNYYSGEPAVKYRGIFINDEFPYDRMGRALWWYEQQHVCSRL